MSLQLPKLSPYVEANSIPASFPHFPLPSIFGFTSGSYWKPSGLSVKLFLFLLILLVFLHAKISWSVVFLFKKARLGSLAKLAMTVAPCGLQLRLSRRGTGLEDKHQPIRKYHDHLSA